MLERFFISHSRPVVQTGPEGLISLRSSCLDSGWHVNDVNRRISWLPAADIYFELDVFSSGNAGRDSFTRIKISKT